MPALNSCQWQTRIREVSPGQHVRNIGEDVVANQLIIPINHRIRPLDIGALLAGGVNQLFARRKPKVAVIPTGNELIPPGEEISPGKIIEYNSKIIIDSAINKQLLLPQQTGVYRL